jgi:hypothetical protein
VANFEDTLNNLAGGIKDNENLNGTFINYLNERIQSLKKSSDAILQHINATDINTENFIRTETNKLKSLTAAALQELDEYVLALKSSIPELKDKTVEKINSSFDFEKEKSDLAALINSKREKLDEMVFSNNDSFDNLRLLVNINEGIQKLISVSGTNKSTVPEDSGNDDKLLPKLNQIVNELNKLNKKLRPSIFHPSELFNFIFSKNGYHKQ